MKKLIFIFSVATICMFAVSCKQPAGADTGALKETYENRMDSLKISLMRSYNAKMDSMQSDYESRIKQLEIQVANAGGNAQGVTSGKGSGGSKYPGGKGSASNAGKTIKTGVTNTGTKAVDITKRGAAGLKAKSQEAAEKVKKTVDISKRGGGN